MNLYALCDENECLLYLTHRVNNENQIGRRIFKAKPVHEIARNRVARFFSFLNYGVILQLTKELLYTTGTLSKWAHNSCLNIPNSSGYSMGRTERTTMSAHHLACRVRRRWRWCWRRRSRRSGTSQDAWELASRLDTALVVEAGVDSCVLSVPK